MWIVRAVGRSYIIENTKNSKKFMHWYPTKEIAQNVCNQLNSKGFEG